MKLFVSFSLEWRAFVLLDASANRSNRVYNEDIRRKFRSICAPWRGGKDRDRLNIALGKSFYCLRRVIRSSIGFISFLLCPSQTSGIARIWQDRSILILFCYTINQIGRQCFRNDSCPTIDITIGQGRLNWRNVACLRF